MEGIRKRIKDKPGNVHNPLYPPYLKGDNEGESPFFKRELVEN
jgi:hypothetical protein